MLFFISIDVIRILLLVVHSHCFLLLFYFCDNSLAIGNKILLNKIMTWKLLYTHHACIIIIIIIIIIHKINNSIKTTVHI